MSYKQNDFTNRSNNDYGKRDYFNRRDDTVQGGRRNVNDRDYRPRFDRNTNNTNYTNNTNNTNNTNYLNYENHGDQKMNDKQNYIKQQLINHIYSNVDLSNFNYKLMEYDTDLNMLTKDKFFVSANYSGSNCLLIFIKVKEKYFSYLVDRKTLNYNKNLVNLDNVKIIQININLDESIYKGTIFNGIFIQTQRGKTFVITDAYQFRGQNTINDKIQYKIMNVVAYLKANLKEDSNVNNLNITVNKLYDIQQTDKLINESIPQQKNLLIKGIAFYPEISGTRLIFMFNNEIKTNQNIDNKSIDKKERENQNDNIIRNLDERDGLKNKKIKVRYVCKSSNPVFATFQLKKTADIDVYKLYLVESSKQNEKNVWKSKRMGIALIPTKECSILCKNIFNKNNNKVFMKCKFISEKNKWQPIEEDLKSTMPTNIDEIEAQLNIIEEETDDEDE